MVADQTRPSIIMRSTGKFKRGEMMRKQTNINYFNHDLFIFFELELVTALIGDRKNECAIVLYFIIHH